MQLHRVIIEVYTGFSRNIFLRLLFLFIIPCFIGISATKYLGSGFIFNNDFARAAFSILLVFVGFYITLLIFINNKVVSLNPGDVVDTDIKYDYIRYIDFSRKITISLIYSILCILISLIILVITLLNFTTDIYIIEIIVNNLGSAILYFLLMSFVIMLFKIIMLLSTYFLNDLKKRKNRINKITF